MPKRLRRNVAACGFLDPTPIQRQAIPLLLAGREVLAVAPTGAPTSVQSFLNTLCWHDRCILSACLHRRAVSSSGMTAPTCPTPGCQPDTLTTSVLLPEALR